MNSSHNKNNAHNKQLISIDDYLTNPNQSLKLNSPRTMQAIKHLGYVQEDLCYVPFTNFHFINSNFHNLTPQMQKRLFTVYNELRLSKIAEVAEYRSNITNTTCSGDNEDSQQNDTTDEHNNGMLEEAMKANVKEYEKLKRRNENEFVFAVESELKRQVMLKEAENKLRRNDFKNGLFKEGLRARKQLEEEMRNEQERIKFEKQQKREQKRLKAEKEQFKQELLQELVLQQQRKDKCNHEDIARKQHEQQQKHLEYMHRVANMNAQKQQTLYDKMLAISHKEENIQLQLAKIKQTKAEQLKRKSDKKRQQIQKNLQNLNTHLQQQYDDYIIKQIKQIEKQERLEQQRLFERKSRAESARLRSEKSKRIIENSKQLQQEKIDNYNHKQMQFALRQIELAQMNHLQEQQRKLLNEEKEQQIQNAKKRNNALLNQRKKRIMEDIERKEHITNEQLLKKQSEHMERVEMNNERSMIMKDNIKRIERLKVNQREHTMKCITNKHIRIEQLKQKQNMLNEHNRKLKEEIGIKKQQYEHSLFKLFHKQNLNHKQLYKIRDMFPNNERIISLLDRLTELEQEKEDDIVQMRNQLNEINEHISKSRDDLRRSLSSSEKNSQMYVSSNEHNRNGSRKSKSAVKKVSKKHNDDDNECDDDLNRSKEFLIQHKLNEYKLQLSNELLVYITEQKKKESKLIDIYNQSSSENKEKLMLQLNELKIESQELIARKKLENEMKYADYEEQLLSQEYS